MLNRCPSLSVITVTLNCAEKLRECFTRLMAQDYPKELLELIVVDGGSDDRTKDVALQFGARFLEAGCRDNQEARRCVGLGYATKEIVLFLDSDNYLPENTWLRQMVEPFEDEEIIATQPLRYLYEPQETLMNRYFALFGVNDPVAFYLKKADRLSYLFDAWNLKGTVVKETASYTKVKFGLSNLATIGSNGFLTRKRVLDTLKLKPEEFFHIDIHVDLIRKGFCHHGIVKCGIIHSTGETFAKNITKRISYMRVHREGLKNMRRYKVFDSSDRQDVMNLGKFIFYTLTLVEPLYLSIKGYLKIKDRAWFIHPFVCIGFLFAYAYACLGNMRAPKRAAEILI
jgi:glycosyltransferase involved in cell wall biosynthesis